MLRPLCVSLPTQFKEHTHLLCERDKKNNRTKHLEVLPIYKIGKNVIIMFVNVELDISGYKRITFEGCRLHRYNSFLTVQLKKQNNWCMCHFMAMVSGYGIFRTLFSVFFSQDFSPIIRLLLTNQSFIDGATCLFATILILQPGVKILDELICHIWNGQFIYWYAVLMSSKC